MSFILMASRDSSTGEIPSVTITSSHYHSSSTSTNESLLSSETFRRLSDSVLLRYLRERTLLFFDRQ